MSNTQSDRCPHPYAPCPFCSETRERSTYNPTQVEYTTFPDHECERQPDNCTEECNETYGDDSDDDNINR